MTVMADRSRRQRGYAILLTEDLQATCAGLARDMDMALSVFIRGVVAGALADGVAARYAERYANRLPPELMKSALTNRKDWIPVDAGYMHEGGWTLEREGLVGKHQVDGEDGWYLAGPGISGRRWAGRTKRDAMIQANAYIARVTESS